jgi:hypothetical protein
VRGGRLAHGGSTARAGGGSRFVGRRERDAEMPAAAGLTLSNRLGDARV